MDKLPLPRLATGRGWHHGVHYKPLSVGCGKRSCLLRLQMAWPAQI